MLQPPARSYGTLRPLASRDPAPHLLRRTPLRRPGVGPACPGGPPGRTLQQRNPAGTEERFAARAGDRRPHLTPAGDSGWAGPARGGRPTQTRRAFAILACVRANAATAAGPRRRADPCCDPGGANRPPVRRRAERAHGVAACIEASCAP